MAEIRRRCVGLFLVLSGMVGGASGLAQAADPARPPIDFGRQVLPILSEHCFACHGPDEKARKAKLRLDTKEGAFGELKSGGHAIVAKKPKESALIERIIATDESVMPPVKFGKNLTKDQIAILQRWIEEGADWKAHWAFTPVARGTVPRPTDPRTANWVRNPIDAFILARLTPAGLTPAGPASKTALIRRVTLDLTGLPPTPAEVEAFVKDNSPEAYERLVDRLLASPRYGEHRARYWLDAARYGDTHGLHLDNYREIWPYRDWVINAYNRNLPFDRFVIEQIAGDLLPNPTLDQIVATGFNRCHVTTSEGGSIEEECYVRNVVDRVDTTGTVLLGMSVGCARCHDHKYDPITQKDYYSMFAFFNSIDGRDLDGNIARHEPVTKVAGPEQLKELARLQASVDRAKAKIAEAVAGVKYDPSKDPDEPTESDKPADYVWVDDALPAGAKTAGDAGINGGFTFTAGPDQLVTSGKKSIRRKVQGLGQVVLTDANPPLMIGAGDKLFVSVYLDPKDPPKEVMLQWFSNDWLHRAYWGENKIDWGADKSPQRFRVGDLPETGKWVRLEVDAAKVGLKPGTAVTGLAFTQFDGTVTWDRAGIVTKTPQGVQKFATLNGWLNAQRASGGANLPKPIQAIVKMTPAKRTPEQTKQLRDYFVENVYPETRALFAPLHKVLTEAQQAVDAYDKAIPATLVFKEAAQPKPSFILKRGEYDQKGAKVDRATPGFLPPMEPNAPKNRLGFAKWVMAPENPLAARVAVNRLWQSIFGTGLVKTSEDFGAQGEPPSHPELLDWLAVEYRETGWDTKRLIKLMVMSAAYQQDAKVTPEKLQKDPANRLLSRGVRYRLDAETLRDQALAASGLLVEKVGGPGVKPPQPPGLWEAVGYLTSNTRNFMADTGAEKVHRRSLYTFWKRTAPPPQMSGIDAPNRESCTVRRERTNTPLQALLLMNEEQYVEASRRLGERGLNEGGPTPTGRITLMFRLAAGRAPDESELAIFQEALARFRATYDKNPEAAKKLIAVGESKPDPKLPPAELAAYAMIGNLILNLDEVLNK